MLNKRDFTTFRNYHSDRDLSIKIVNVIQNQNVSNTLEFLDSEYNRVGDYTIVVKSGQILYKIVVGKKCSNKYELLDDNAVISLKTQYLEYYDTFKQQSALIPHAYDPIVIEVDNKSIFIERQEYISSPSIFDVLSTGDEQVLTKCLEVVVQSIASLLPLIGNKIGIDANPSNYLEDGTFVDFLPPFIVGGSDYESRQNCADEHNQRFLRYFYTQEGVFEFILVMFGLIYPKSIGLLLEAAKKNFSSEFLLSIEEYLSDDLFSDDLEFLTAIYQKKRNIDLSQNKSIIIQMYKLKCLVC